MNPASSPRTLALGPASTNLISVSGIPPCPAREKSGSTRLPEGGMIDALFAVTLAFRLGIEALHEQFGSWRTAVSGFRRGRPPPGPARTARDAGAPTGAPVVRRERFRGGRPGAVPG